MATEQEQKQDEKNTQATEENIYFLNNLKLGDAFEILMASERYEYAVCNGFAIDEDENVQQTVIKIIILGDTEYAPFEMLVLNPMYLCFPKGTYLDWN